MSTAQMDAKFPPLTSFAHGGGCGCKLSPAVLSRLLSQIPSQTPYANLLVGTETSDDAAVWKIDESTCVIATTDFFLPIVDDPHDFGRIAATNAISDIYAMGGRPIMALAILGMPIGKIPDEMISAILAGGAEACRGAGIPVAGGHSIDTLEPIYGLAVVGIGHPQRIRTNRLAQPGDDLILTKPLGVGVYSAALKKGRLDTAAYKEMLASMTQLNAIGSWLAEQEVVHALTDVTGFGLLGHALEMARGSGVGIAIDGQALPFLDQAVHLAGQGFITGASTRNWDAYGEHVHLPDNTSAVQKALLTDPQTSGGLLLSCHRSASDSLLTDIRAAGFAKAARIGQITTCEQSKITFLNK